jgi:ApeA N-terminal domain 1
MADEHNQLGSHFTVVGAFWPPDNADAVVTGTLTVDDKDVTFATAPEYKRLGPGISLSLSLGNENLGEKVPVFHGFTQDGLCTLCDLMVVEVPGLTHHGLGQQVLSVTYRASMSVTGLHLGGSTDKCLTSARYSFSGLSDWLPKATSEAWDAEYITLKIPLKSREIVDFSVRDNRVRITIKVFSQLTSNFIDGARISKSVAYIDVESPTAESLLWFYEIGNRLENLFSLLTGASLAWETFFVYRGEENGHVTAKRRNRVKTFDPRECVRCSADQLANAVAIWLSAPPSFRSVESLALGVVRKGKLFLETEFLSLAQALEGVHRVTTHGGVVDRATFRQIRKKIVTLLKQENVDPLLTRRICDSLSHANDLTFAGRLSELCSRMSGALLDRVAINPEEFVSAVVAVRNFYTHAGSTMRNNQNNNPMSAKDLFFLSQKMNFLLRGTLLLYLGIEEKQFSDVLTHQTTRWK